MVANKVFEDPRGVSTVFCYTDTAMPADAYVTIGGIAARISKVYTSANGWNPGPGNSNQGVIGFNYLGNAFTYGDTFVINSASQGNTTVSNYGPAQSTPTPTPTLTPSVTPTKTVTPTPTASVTPTPTPSAAAASTKAIFAFGSTTFNMTNPVAITNIVSDTGVMASDVTYLSAEARSNGAGASYGNGLAILCFGRAGSTITKRYNYVDSSGVVDAGRDAGFSVSNRYYVAGTSYGGDKAIFGYGISDPNGTGEVTVSITNLVDNLGNIANDTTGVGTVRFGLGAASYGSGKAKFAYGIAGSTYYNISNDVSNTGVVSTDSSGVGTARAYLGAAKYGGDKAIFGYGFTGSFFSITNLVSNTGVIATDTAGVGTARALLAAAGYSTDKAIFGFGINGFSGSTLSMTNLVSNTGVVATDTSTVATARHSPLAASFTGV